MKSEYVVLLDADGTEIGTAEKYSAHHADTPLHKAFSCYVFNDRNRLLVTKRADGKKVWPGVWTNSVCGHPAPGEPTEAAITRRLMYELGMAADNVRVVAPHYRYKTPPYNGIIENEICPVYIAHALGEPQPNPEEVADYKWVGWAEYTQALAADTDNTFSWWSKDQLQHIRTQIDALLHAKPA
ncbi:MAG TPA: isopentenyl-diphosphate Delta-isomerase [Candidatus Saccharimonadales bacterium]|nr:isopentenyl-diphosphate Delta-isomerase [Candidatus Saccharimonadales bacterium]